MRIIPKKSNVRLEFIPGIGVIELIIFAIGVLVAAMLIFSRLPLKYVAAGFIFLLTCVLIFPVGHDKGYEMVRYLLLFLMQQKVYLRKAETDSGSMT